MGSVRTLDDHTPSPVMAMSSESRTTMELEAVNGRGQAKVPAWLLVFAILGGGGAGSAGAALFGTSSVDVVELRMEQSAHKARLDAHDMALEQSTERHLTQQRWLSDVLVVQSRAIAGIAEKVGARVDTTVPQYTEGR